MVKSEFKIDEKPLTPLTPMQSLRVRPLSALPNQLRAKTVNLESFRLITFSKEKFPLFLEWFKKCLEV